MYPDAAPEYQDFGDPEDNCWAVLLELGVYVSDNEAEWYDDGCYGCHCHT